MRCLVVQLRVVAPLLNVAASLPRKKKPTQTRPANISWQLYVHQQEHLSSGAQGPGGGGGMGGLAQGLGGGHMRARRRPASKACSLRT